MTLSAAIATALNPRTFTEVTALTETAPGRFEAEVDPDWTIGSKPNGGYLLAMLGRAAASVSPHDHASRVDSRADRVDEACFVWDRTGRLVAQGTQLAGVRLR